MCKIRNKNNLFDELYLSFLECAKNKSNTINAINFIINKEKNLISLKYYLENKTYKSGKSIYFIVTKPKVREVFAADFRDRIIHHFFIRSIEKNFYENSTNSIYSCIRGKGTHLAIKNIQEKIFEYKYYLQIDIKSFFMSIDKHILKQKIKQYLPQDIDSHINQNLVIDYDLEIYNYLLDIIVDFDPTFDCIYKGDKKLIKLLPKEKSLFNLQKGKGLAIGNYSSQFFANIYLNELDKYILNLGFNDYFRYVDDLLILGNDYKKLQKLIILINNYLQEHLFMQLVPEKIKLKDINHGIDFLGYFIKRNTTYVRKRVIHNLIEKIDIIKTNFISYIDIISLKKVNQLDFGNKNHLVKILDFEENKLNNIIAIFSSYVSHMKHANAKHLLKKILYKNSFLQYIFDFRGKKRIYLKNKKFKNTNKAYYYYDKLYKNTILFFPYNNYYIFKNKYNYLLKNLDKKYLDKVIIYRNIGFKIEKTYYKIIILQFLKTSKSNIILINKNIYKYNIQKLFIINKNTYEK